MFVEWINTYISDQMNYLSDMNKAKLYSYRESGKEETFWNLGTGVGRGENKYLKIF